MFLVEPYTKHFSIAEWNGATGSWSTDKTTSAPNVSVAQRFTLLGDILTVAASPHTRDPVRFRTNQPTGGAQNKNEMRKDL